MATLISLKRRIKTAKNVSKTTKAMQLISASKLKKAQDAAVMAKPYVAKLEVLSKELAAKIEKNNLSEYMIKPDNINSKLYIVISPDKGLSGGLVTNLIREVANLDTKSKDYFIVIGKKAQTYVSALDKEIIAAFPFGTTLPSFDVVYGLSKLVNEYFLGKKVNEVVIITTKFVSVFTQTPNKTTLLPIAPQELLKTDQNLVFEPSVKELLPDLLQHYVEMVIYQSFLESYASEQAARMIAMKNATDNAKEMISDLNLIYNKTRQEKITNELLDIGGASYAQN